jgi:glycosyltransferase involved in cell wall biosynthesis
VIRLACLGELFSQPILPKLWAVLWKESRRADVVHFHSPNPIAELLSLFLHKPRFVTFHADVVRQKGLISLYGVLQKLFFRKAARIFVASTALKRTSPALRSFQERISLIPFGLDSGRFQANARIRKYLEELKLARPYVLFVGRLVSYKGLPVLLEAIRSLQCDLRIVGDGPQEEELRRLAAASGCGERVIFHGAIQDEERLGAIFLGARVVVLPSITRAEAFGMVLIEAMGWGIPVISTALDTGVSEVNEHEKTGLVVPVGDAGALASAIRRILESDALYEKFSQNGAAKFRESYAATMMADRILSEYTRHA